MSCLGVGVDPLTLAVDILTAAMFDSDLFDATFGGLVAANAEGRVIAARALPVRPACPSPAKPSASLLVAQSRCKPRERHCYS